MKQKLFRKLAAAALAAVMALTAAPAVYATEDEDILPMYRMYEDYELPWKESVEISDEEYEKYISEREAQRDALGLDSDENAPLPDGASASKYNTSTNYFRNLLANNEEKAMYDEIVKQCEEFYWSKEEPYSIQYSDGSFGYYFGNIELGNVSLDRAKQISAMVYHACPKYFFFCWSLLSSSKKFSLTLWDDFNTRDTINYYRDKIEQITESWMSEIDAVKSPLEKEMMIVKKMVDHNTYSHSYTDPRTGAFVEDDWHNQFISGHLVNKAAVCNGIAKTAQYFLNAAGIDALYLQSITGGNHAWNMINLYGNWFCLDVTWMDPDRSDGKDSLHLADTQHNLNTSYKIFQQVGKYIKSHTYSAQYDEWNTPLPDCVTDEVNSGDVSATFEGKTLTFSTLTSLAKDKAFKAATGTVTITINADFTTAQTFAFPSKATAITLTAPEKHTVNLKAATLTSKGSLTVENLTLVSGKKNTGLTAKTTLTVKNSTVGALKAASAALVTSKVNGKIAASGELTITGTQCDEDVSMTSKAANITLSNSTANKKVTSSGGVILTNGSYILGALKATGILTLNVGTHVMSTVTAGGIEIAA